VQYVTGMNSVEICSINSAEFYKHHYCGILQVSVVQNFTVPIVQNFIGISGLEFYIYQ